MQTRHQISHILLCDIQRHHKGNSSLITCRHFSSIFFVLGALLFGLARDRLGGGDCFACREVDCLAFLPIFQVITQLIQSIHNNSEDRVLTNHFPIKSDQDEKQNHCFCWQIQEHGQVITIVFVWLWVNPGRKRLLPALDDLGVGSLAR